LIRTRLATTSPLFPYTTLFRSVDGRNVWRADLSQALKTLTTAQPMLGDRLWVAPSCSLLHCPVDLDLETQLDPEIKSWLAFSIRSEEHTSELQSRENLVCRLLL